MSYIGQRLQLNILLLSVYVHLASAQGTLSECVHRLTLQGEQGWAVLPLPTQDEHLRGLGKTFIICHQASFLAQTVDNLIYDEIYYFITHHKELGANF